MVRPAAPAGRVDVVKPKHAVRFDRTIGRAFYRVHRLMYQMSGGRIGHRTPEGPMLVLTTRGRRSGQPRASVLLYMPDGDDAIVVGSNGGRPQAPAWLLNLQADPKVQVQIGSERFRAHAEIIEGEARDAIWPRLKEHYPGWDHYQTLTDRPIHPVRLVRER